MIEIFVAVVAALLVVMFVFPWLLGNGGAFFAGLWRLLCLGALVLFIWWGAATSGG